MDVILPFLVCVAGHLAVVFSYPNGNISVSCDSMLPGHGKNVPHTTVAPYTITVSKTTFNPGDVITVTIDSKYTGFSGFLLEARSVGGDWITGTFTITDWNTQTLTCSAGPNTAVSHTSNNIKKSITTSWTAPEGSGPVKFRATVVNIYNIFWTGVESNTIVALQISNATCGSQKFCLSNPMNCSPDNSNCAFMSSIPTSNGYVVEMSAPTSGYVAIGLSDDQKMGNDDVYICTKNSSGYILVQRAYTTGPVAPVVRNTSTAASAVTSYVNGVLKCSFIIYNSTQQRSTADSNYYIFLANGPSAANGQIQKHTKTPLISSDKVDLSSFVSHAAELAEPEETLKPIVRGHGALMLIAWMTTGSIGMITARYMKNAGETPFLGLAIWFHVHVILMVLTVILTIIAFIMVFVAEAGWCSDAGAHPVLGCIVMILSFFQPFVALLRPDPESERRFIFNWGHTINALVIKILAVATIFLGLILMDTTTTKWMPKVMGGFFAWEVLFYIILETNMQWKPRVWKTYEITDNEKSRERRISTLEPDLDFAEESSSQAQVQTIALVIFIGGNLAFLISLLVGIGQS